MKVEFQMIIEIKISNYSQIKIIQNKNIIIQAQMLSSLNLKSASPIEKQDHKKIKIILQSLLDHSDSQDFREPVDWKGMGLTDYPSVVKYPMDLGTVNKKFNQGKYTTIQQLCDDIQIIWDNCKSYNLPNSWIYQTAQKLQRAFRKMSRNYFPDLGITIPTKQQTTKKSQNPTTGNQMIDQEYEDITYRDKLRFCEQLSFLSSKNLQKIVKQIQKKCPNAYKETTEGQCQVLVDDMDFSLFNQIFSHIKDMNKSSILNEIEDQIEADGDLEKTVKKIKGN